MGKDLQLGIVALVGPHGRSLLSALNFEGNM